MGVAGREGSVIQVVLQEGLSSPVSHTISSVSFVSQSFGQCVPSSSEVDQVSLSNIIVD